MIHSGIPTPDNTQHSLFHWKMILIKERNPQLIRLQLS